MFALLIMIALSGATSNPQLMSERHLPPAICHAHGKIFSQGETACLAYRNSEQLARCGMVLNNSSWIRTDETCVAQQTDEGAEQDQDD